MRKLVENGHISSNETIVCYVTGNGLKTTEAIIDQIPRPTKIQPSLDSFKAVIKPKEATIWSK